MWHRHPYLPFVRCPLHWRHNERDGVSNHQPDDCLLNRLFKAQIKENIKAPRHWPLWGEFTGDRWISQAEGCEFNTIIYQNKISQAHVSRLMVVKCQYLNQKAMSQTVSVKWYEKTFWCGNGNIPGKLDQAAGDLAGFSHHQVTSSRIGLIQ